MVVYSVDSTVLRQFIKTPSLEILNEQNRGTVVETFDISKGSEHIEMVIKDGVTTQCCEDESGVNRIGNLPVYTEFVEFMKEKDNIEAILEKNGVEGNIDYYCIIEDLSYAEIPVSIWIKTALNNYFVTINESIEDWMDDPNSTEFVYRFYNHTDYCNKFGLKDGSLIVNGENITEGNYIKFEYNKVYLPFRAVVEKLGYAVGWDEKNYWATFSDKSGAEYALRLNDYPIIVKKSNADISGYLPPGGSAPFCSIINDRTIIDEWIMKDIADILGATVNINYETSTVTIETQGDGSIVLTN